MRYAEFSTKKKTSRFLAGILIMFALLAGCSEPGQFTYMRAYDKEFLNVVKLRTTDTPVDGQGLIRRSELEKYHLLSYFSGRTVYILQSPTEERFIWVSRSVDRPSDTFTLPEGWTLTTHVLQTELQLELSGNVSVLRTDNEDSYQGPLPVLRRG